MPLQLFPQESAFRVPVLKGNCSARRVRLATTVRFVFPSGENETASFREEISKKTFER
jgi:hypothetical protein